jgi:hypothetical protein
MKKWIIEIMVSTSIRIVNWCTAGDNYNALQILNINSKSIPRYFHDDIGLIHWVNINFDYQGRSARTPRLHLS